MSRELGKEMIATLEPFLSKAFESSFTHYKKEWVDLALSMIAENQELIASDAIATVPALGKSDDFARDFADVMETDTTLQGPLFYRIAHALYLRDPSHVALRYFAYLMKARAGMEIYYSASIGPRFLVMHGVGVVVGPRYTIGSDFTLYQGVTLGQRRFYSSHETIVIGDRVTIFAGAAVLGNVRVGDDVRIAANAVLLSDAEANSTYAGIPAVKVK